MVPESDMLKSLIPELYKKFVQCDIDEFQVNDLIKGITSFRDLASEFVDYPEKVLSDIFNSKIEVDIRQGTRTLCYYPTEFLSIRDILNRGRIFKVSKLSLFSLAFCHKHLTAYPILLGVEVPKKDVDVFGGIAVSRCNPLYVSGKINKIYIREDQLDQDKIRKVEQLAKQADESITVHRLGDIPSNRAVCIVSYNQKRSKEMSDSWYQRIKVADASSSEDPGSGATFYEGKPAIEDTDEISFGPHPAVVPFQKGDKVKLRYGGMGFSQTIGRVESVTGDGVIIVWETGKIKGKQSTFALTDTTSLFSTLEKVQ